MHMGPSVGNRDVLMAGVRPNVGFASAEFIAAMKQALEGLLEVAGAGADYLPLMLPGSGTAAMESVTTFLRKGDRVLVLSNGLFGDRWARIFERYPVTVDYVGAAAGESVTPAALKEGARGRKYRLVAVTHVETSTGVRAPVEELIASAREVSDIVAVDGVASVGGEDVRTGAWDADIVLTASQKAIGAAPGLGLLVVRKSLLGRKEGNALSGYFLDLNNWAPVMEGMMGMRGGYFATPPISAIFSLADALRRAREEGMVNRISRHEEAARAIRGGMEELGLGIVAGEGLRSNTVTGVSVGTIDADDFVRRCLDKGVEFATGVHPAIRGRYFRIGHMGWVTHDEVDAAIRTVASTLAEVRAGT